MERQHQVKRTWRGSLTQDIECEMLNELEYVLSLDSQQIEMLNRLVRVAELLLTANNSLDDVANRLRELGKTYRKQNDIRGKIGNLTSDFGKRNRYNAAQRRVSFLC